MRTGAGLALVCVGAILAFAVKAHASVINVQVIGWILMLTGVVGLLMPRRAYGWLGRRMLVRRTVQNWPGDPAADPGTVPADGTVPGDATAAAAGGRGRTARRRTARGAPGERVEEIPIPPFLARNPGTSRARVGLPPKPLLDPDSETRTPRPPEDSEIVEDLYEN
jgi:hypothetical protein